jgi:hypothetical protein
MESEEDTFRILKRSSFEEAKEAIAQCRNKLMKQDLQAEIDTLWKLGWRTREYLREVKKRNLNF